MFKCFSVISIAIGYFKNRLNQDMFDTCQEYALICQQDMNYKNTDLVSLKAKHNGLWSMLVKMHAQLELYPLLSGLSLSKKVYKTYYPNCLIKT